MPVLCFTPPARPDAAEVTTPLSYNLTQRDIGLEALYCQDFDDLSTYLFLPARFPVGLQARSQDCRNVIRALQAG